MENKSSNIISSIVTWLVVLLPILRNYKSGINGINLAELFVGIVLLIIIFKRNNSSLTLTLEKKYQFLILMLILILLISIIDFYFVDFSFADFISLYLRFSFYIIALIIFSKYFNVEKGNKILNKCAILCCILLIIQLIMFYIFNKSIAFKLPFLQLDKSSLYTGIFVKNISGLRVFRASSLFFEPAHFGYYIAISLAVELFLSKRKNMLLLIFYSICVILSTSSGGILLCCIVWFYFFICNFSLNASLRMIVIFCFLFFVYKFFSNSYFLNYIINKIIAIFGKSSGSSVRISSIDYFNLLDPRSKIMGIGFGNAEYFFNNSHIDFGYTSSLAGLLLWNGLVGCISVFYCFAKMIKRIIKKGRIFIYVFLISMIGTSMLTSINVLFFLVWALSVKEFNRNEETL